MLENSFTRIKEYDFFRRLCDLSFIEEIWLYGSRARGDYKERSDIDLAIICPMATQSEWFKVLDVVDEADTLLKVDVVKFPGLLDEELKLNIIKDKIVLYKKVIG